MLFKQSIKHQFLPYRKKVTHTHIYNEINLTTLIIVYYSKNQVKLGEIPSYLTSVQVGCEPASVKMSYQQHIFCRNINVIIIIIIIIIIMLKYPSNQSARFIKPTYSHLTYVIIRFFAYFYIFWRNSAIFRASVHQYLKLTKI